MLHGQQILYNFKLKHALVMLTKRPNNITIKNLTNNECRKLLNETLHRMDFLRDLQDNIFNFVNALICSTNKPFEKTLIYNETNDYFIALHIYVNVTLNEKYMVNMNPAVYYNESGLKNGKINSPELYINIIKNQNGDYDEYGLRTAIYHEITHLYDDWQWMKNGHEPLCLDTKVVNDNEFLRKLINSDVGIHKVIGWGLYLNSFFENNAFINQTESELRKLGCTPKNISHKIKSTSAYRNYKKLKIDVKYYLAHTNDNELFELNTMILQSGMNKSIPCINKGTLNTIVYKEKIIKWIETIFRKFIKRYCGAVQHYIDIYQMMNFKNR